MINGVSFQPGQPGSQTSTRPRTAPANTGVQEAIKVLSLRLPRVVGAQALAPAPLLHAQGSGGNPRVDSVVNQVLSRMLPTEGSAGPAPAAPAPAPTFNGIPANTPLSTFMQPHAAAPPMGDGQRAPRIVPADHRPREPIISPDAGQGDGTKEVIQSAPPDQPAADPMSDFLEFLRRNQVFESTPPPEQYSI